MVRHAPHSTDRDARNAIRNISTADSPASILEFYHSARIIEVVDVFVLETPAATVLAYVRFKGEACYLAEMAMIPSLDILPIVSMLADAVANVTSKVEVFKSFLTDLRIGELIQIVERSIGANERTHLLMQTAFRLISGHELRSGRLYACNAFFDVERPRTVAPDIATSRTKIDRHKVSQADRFRAGLIHTPRQ